jgi:hypothetical protein
MITNPYLFSIQLATLFGWLSWLLVIHKMSPFLIGILALALFYASLFLSLTGTCALLIYYLKAGARSSVRSMSILSTALRQGLLLSVLINTFLIFQRLRVLTWWDGMLLMGILALIELYFMTKD